MDKYVKVVYQTEPIGEYGIILYLTTFDVEKYDEDQILLNQQKHYEQFSIARAVFSQDNYWKYIEERLNEYVVRYYEPKIKELEELIEKQKTKTKLINTNAETEKFVKEVKNISNSNDVHCDIVYGNISNCDNIYCNTIMGNVSNCDKIVYKGDKNE